MEISCINSVKGEHPGSQNIHGLLLRRDGTCCRAFRSINLGAWVLCPFLGGEQGHLPLLLVQLEQILALTRGVGRHAQVDPHLAHALCGVLGLLQPLEERLGRRWRALGENTGEAASLVRATVSVGDPAWRGGRQRGGALLVLLGKEGGGGLVLVLGADAGSTGRGHHKGRVVPPLSSSEITLKGEKIKNLSLENFFHSVKKIFSKL